MVGSFLAWLKILNSYPLSPNAPLSTIKASAASLTLPIPLFSDKNDNEA